MFGFDVLLTVMIQQVWRVKYLINDLQHGDAVMENISSPIYHNEFEKLQVYCDKFVSLIDGFFAYMPSAYLGITKSSYYLSFAIDCKKIQFEFIRLLQQDKLLEIAKFQTIERLFLGLKGLVVGKRFHKHRACNTQWIRV